MNNRSDDPSLHSYHATTRTKEIGNTKNNNNKKKTQNNNNTKNNAELA